MDLRLTWFGLTEVVSLHCSREWWEAGMAILKDQGADAWRTWMYGG